MNNTKLSAVVANEAAIDSTLVSSNHKKSTINKAYIKANYLPIEIWHIIREELNLQEVLNLRKVNTFFADKIVDIDFISKKFYVKNLSFYKQAYSISSYQNTIAPVLENLSPDIKLMIDEHIKENKNYPLFSKQLPRYIATKVAIATMNLETTGSTVKSFSFPNDHANFTVNTIGTHCACIKDLNQVIIFAITIKHGFQKITSFQLSNHDDSISYMQFTPKNNLLTYSSAKELTLWELNLDENKAINPPKKLWDLKLDNTKLLNQIVLFNTEKEFLLSYHLEKELYFYSQDNNKYFQEKLMNNHFDFSHIQCIYNITISANNNSLAIIFKIRDFNNLTINLVSLTNSKEIEQITTLKTNVSECEGMNFNIKGDVFVYYLRDCIYVLRKKNNKWFLVLMMYEDDIYDVKIMPTEKHLIFNSNKYFYITDLIKSRYTTENIGSMSTYVYGQKDRALVINRVNTRYSVWGKCFDSYYIHPTGLAVITFDEETKQLQIITPTKKKFLVYVKDKLFYFHDIFILFFPVLCLVSIFLFLCKYISFLFL
jgi:hypothetical protein